MMSIYWSRSFPRSNSSFLLCSGNASQSSVLRLRLREEMFLVDAGLGTPKICMQDELTGLPIKRATRFENKVGSKNVVAGESLIKKRIEERFFIDLVAGESLIKERAAARFKDFVGSLDVTAGEPLLLPQRFRQNRAWIELKKIWRTKKKVKGFLINKIEGGYSVAIAGFITFLPFKALKKKRRANARFTIDSFIPKRTTLIVRPTMKKLTGTRSYSSASHSSPAPGGKKRFRQICKIIGVIAVLAIPLLFGCLTALGLGAEELASVLGSRLAFLFQCLGETFFGGRLGTLGMGQGESPAPEEPVPGTEGKPLLMEVPQEGRKRKAPLEIEGPPTLRGPEDFIEVSPSPSPKEGERLTPTTGPSPEGGDHAGDNMEPAPLPVEPAAPPAPLPQVPAAPPAPEAPLVEENAIQKIQHDTIRCRLETSTSQRTVNDDDIDCIISIKKDIINRMAQLDPDGLWTEQKDHLVAHGILNKDKEYTLKGLMNLSKKLDESGTNCEVFHKMKKLKEEEWL